MSTPEERSDQLDERLAALPRIEMPPRWLIGVMGVVIVLNLLGSVFQYVKLRDLSGENHKVLVSQIPGLKKQIADRDIVISDQQNELGQAVAAITTLCTKLEARGGDCGHIEIKPPPHPKQKASTP